MTLKNRKVYTVALSFVLALVLFIWGFNFLKGKDVFNKEQLYIVEYKEVNGLIKSNPVVINGLRVGQVRDIYFHPSLNGKLIVVLALTTKFPVPDNSIARIFSSDLMGSKAIELQLGTSKTYLMPNDTLLSSIEASLMDEVNAQVLPLKNKAETLLSSVDSLVVILQTILSENAKDNIFSSLQSVSATIQNLERTTLVIDSVVSTESSRISSILYNIELITRNFEQNNGEINTILSNMAALSDSLVKADIGSVVHHADASLAELNKLLDAINRGQGTVGQMMHNDTLYYQLEKSAEELNKLLEDVRLNPKRYVKFSLF
ncbi:MAG: MCE family protein [Bacteroidetes bacterium]|jgi:phospholipid/cholesterol/gamma-HCH transport system substrate-binding protein|nr:MCE family protein [Bacteroidota bacterium]